MSSALLRSAAGRLTCVGRCAVDAPVAADVDEEWWEEARADEQPEVQAEVELPPPTATRVKTAEYKSSAVRLDQCPPATLPEFAVIGRSNVGKSSLINMLTNNKGLAKVSKTPGKTQCINHFLINSSWYLVDLPGYGYAKKSKSLRAQWSDFTQEYFMQRDSLANVLLLLDASVPVQALDLEVANWLGNAQVPFSLVFTKVDKRKKGVPPPQDNMAAFQERLLKDWAYLPGVVATSAISATGRAELLAYIAQLRELFTRERGKQAGRHI
ncbi:hypothetical protein WJX81_004920 [Elliptochloris bilobata]|uniref:EngB-type G domain-containing protein n=1 Tax=Elliptochloris bilobata TaxID=381761 RepID=A0AAW1SLM8_9CHLO